MIKEIKMHSHFSSERKQKNKIIRLRDREFRPRTISKFR